MIRRPGSFKSILLLFLFPCILALSSCKGLGQVDENCYYGPIPSEQSMAELHSIGVKTIVDCRQRPNHKKRTAALCQKYKMNYVLIKTGLYTKPRPEVIDKFISVISDPRNCPVYVCDVAAKDRTQFYLSVYRIAKNGWNAKDASWRMYRGGLRHWWPWFYMFPGVLKDNEKQFRQSYQKYAKANEEEIARQIANQSPGIDSKSPGTDSKSSGTDSSKIRETSVAPGNVDADEELCQSADRCRN